MEINDRIRALRKELGVNQAEFGESLGLRQSTIGNYESGSRAVSDATILAICRHYGVNEEWLRYGSGEMFVSLPSSAVSGLVKEYALDAMDQALITEYLKLDPQGRSVLKEYVKRVYLAADEQAAIDHEVASYREELQAEKREKERSSASGTTDAKEA